MFASAKDPKLCGGCGSGLCPGLGFLEQVGLLISGGVGWEGPPTCSSLGLGEGSVSQSFSPGISRANEALAQEVNPCLGI